MASLIVSITGLQNLPNLQNFNADWNALETLNLSGLTNLTNVDVSDSAELTSTGLKSIDVTGCTSLQTLYVDDNDFSAGFPDLSDCASLEWIDFDQCGLTGSINLSNLPALQGFDLSGNTDLTSVIISSSQPMGTRSINLSGCSSLTQTALDDILQQLSSGSISGGSISFQSSALPSLNTGLPALRNLVDDKGWSYSNDGNYSQAINITEVWPTSGEACTAITNNFTGNGYIYTGTSVVDGNRVFTDNDLIYPMENGYFGNFDNGLWYQVSGGNGTIIASGSCV